MAVDERPLLSVRSVAERLGVSERLVWRMVGNGDLPSVKIENVRRVRPADVDAYIARQQDAGDG